MKLHPEVAYEGVGVALPGRADALSQRSVSAPNLGWRDLDLKTPLERATGWPVVVGEVTYGWDRVGPIGVDVVKRRSFTQAVTRILPVDPEAQPRLRGPIALVLQKHFGASFIA
jgi:hypothetical protein